MFGHFNDLGLYNTRFPPREQYRTNGVRGRAALTASSHHVGGRIHKCAFLPSGSSFLAGMQLTDIYTNFRAFDSISSRVEGTDSVSTCSKTSVEITPSKFEDTGKLSNGG